MIVCVNSIFYVVLAVDVVLAVVVVMLIDRLLLIHGSIDENVHFRHTARLLRALVKYGKKHQLVRNRNT